jgi:hypothetical protein
MAYYHYKPVPPEQRVETKTVSIEHRGWRWNATWRMADKVVWVDSAYGSASRAPGQTPPKDMAAQLLAEQVDAWLRP